MSSDHRNQDERREQDASAEPAATETPGTVQPAGESASEDKPASDTVEEEAAASPPTEAEILREERDRFEQKWLRVVAELDNLRKRTRREVADARRHAQADLLRSFLDVHDNMERALQSLRDSGDNGDTAGYLAGMELIHQNLAALLRDRGVQPIEALDREFDPSVHEAVGQLPRAGVEAGIVIEIVQQGFTFGEQLLRPARVIIAAEETG